MYNYFPCNGHPEKRVKGTEKCAMKQEIKFEDYKTYLEIKKTILRTENGFRCEASNVVTGKVNKIDLSGKQHIPMIMGAKQNLFSTQKWKTEYK